eukprot:365483-Chlamydomonas_euryale.AAC.6
MRSSLTPLRRSAHGSPLVRPQMRKLAHSSPPARPLETTGPPQPACQSPMRQAQCSKHAAKRERPQPTHVRSQPTSAASPRLQPTHVRSQPTSAANPRPQPTHVRSQPTSAANPRPQPTHVVSDADILRDAGRRGPGTRHTIPG